MNPLDFIPPELRERIPTIPEIFDEEDPMIWLRFYSPIIEWTWYAAAMSPWPGGDTLFFGWVIGLEKEAGSFFFSEIVHRGGLVVLDLSFQPCRLSEVRTHEGG